MGEADGGVREAWQIARVAHFAQRIVVTIPIASANRNAWIVLILTLTGRNSSDFAPDFEKSPIPFIR
jgi:hypothetical protein